MDTRTPLERMIDAACHVDEPAALIPLARLSRTITLRCRVCGDEKLAPRDVTDPAAAAVILSLCPKCGDNGVDDISYLDKDGRDMGGVHDQ